jgi:hypothetical protein
MLGNRKMKTWAVGLFVAGVGTAAVPLFASMRGAGADAVPACSPGFVSQALTAGGRTVETFADQPLAQAPKVLSAQAAFDLVNAGPKANGWDYASDPSTKANYCVAFGLLTDTASHVGGFDSPLRYANTPMWAVYVGGLTLYPSGGDNGHIQAHHALVYFVDAATGNLLYSETVA